MRAISTRATAAPVTAPVSAPIAESLAPCVQLRQNPWSVFPDLDSPAARLIFAAPRLLSAARRTADGAVFAHWLFRGGDYPFGDLSRPRSEGPRSFSEGYYGAAASMKTGGQVYAIDWARIAPAGELADGALALALEMARKVMLGRLRDQARKLGLGSVPAATPIHPLENAAVFRRGALRAAMLAGSSTTRPSAVEVSGLPLEAVPFNFVTDLFRSQTLIGGRPGVPPVGALIFGTCSLYPMVHGSIRRHVSGPRAWSLEVSKVHWEILDLFSFDDDGPSSQPLGVWTPGFELVLRASVSALFDGAPPPKVPLIELTNRSFRGFAQTVKGAFNSVRQKGSCQTYPGEMRCQPFWLHSVSEPEPVSPPLAVRVELS